MTDSPSTQPPPNVDDESLSARAIDYDGPGIVNASFAGTGLVLVAAGAGVANPDGFGGLTAVVSIACFLVGVVAFLYAYALGVVRSRDDQVTLAGLFFLSHTAPKVVRFRLRLAFFVQCAIAVAAASIRPYTSVAFAVLAPLLGLGLMAMWGARHGTFFPKDDDRRTAG